MMEKNEFCSINSAQFVMCGDICVITGNYKILILEKKKKRKKEKRTPRYKIDFVGSALLFIYLW